MGARHRPGGRVVMQRTANPRTPVRFRPRPPYRNAKGPLLRAFLLVHFPIKGKRALIRGRGAGASGGGALQAPCPPASACGRHLLLYLRLKGTPTRRWRWRGELCERRGGIVVRSEALPRRGRGALRVSKGGGRSRRRRPGDMERKASRPRRGPSGHGGVNRSSSLGLGRWVFIIRWIACRRGCGARGGGRTRMVLPPRDFKSLAYTSFATRAGNALGCLSAAPGGSPKWGSAPAWTQPKVATTSNLPSSFSASTLAGMP